MLSRIYLLLASGLFLIDGKRGTNLAFDKVADTSFGHDRDGDCGHDIFDHGGIGHASNTTFDSDIGGDSLEGHDGCCTGFFSDAGLYSISMHYLRRERKEETHLLGIDDVHDNAAFQHLSQTSLDGEVGDGAATVLL